MAEERGVDIPALVYEARPVVSPHADLKRNHHCCNGHVTQDRWAIHAEHLEESLCSGGLIEHVAVRLSKRLCASMWEARGGVVVRLCISVRKVVNADFAPCSVCNARSRMPTEAQVVACRNN